MNVNLKRISAIHDCTFGVMIHDDIPICVTIERPWIFNKKDISCIPTGTYKCIPHTGEKFKDVWEITNVPGRTNILFHAGNTVDDTHGCILVGRQFTPVGLILSKLALCDLRKILPSNFTLIIEDIT